MTFAYAYSCCLLFGSCLVLGLVQGQSSVEDDPESPFYVNTTGRTETEVLMAKWAVMEKSLKSGVDTVIRTAMPYLLRAVSEADVDSECQSGLFGFLSGIRDLKGWAFKMLDAIGKPTSGVFAGTVTFLGAFDECLSIENRNKNDQLLFRGQYCTLELRPPLPDKPTFYTMHHRMPVFRNASTPDSAIRDFHELLHVFYLLSFRVGLCLPSVCSRNDVQKIAQLIADRVYFTATVPRCELHEPTNLTTVQLVILGCFAALIILLLVGTSVHFIYDKCCKRSHKKMANATGFEQSNILVRLLICFSAKLNFPLLLRGSSSESDRFLHAMRAISSAWLVAGSVFLSLNYQILSQLRNAIDLSGFVVLQPIFSSPLAIDTFLFTTAYLLAAHFNRQQSLKSKVLNYIAILLNKASRLLPALLFATGLALILPLATDGPMAKEVTNPIYSKCIKHWWSNLVFIGNFAQPADERCLFNSWYLSSEMQLMVVGLMIVFVWSFFKRPSLGWCAVTIGLACVISSAIVGAITVVYEFPPTVLFSQIDLKARSLFEDMINQKPYAHLSTWVIGMTTGYFLSLGHKNKMNKVSTVVGWVLFCICSSSVVFGVYEWNRTEMPTPVLTAVYAMAHRPVWALCLAWLAYTCKTGNAKTINDLLSWSGWVPISRLSYIQYLVFPMFQDLIGAHARDALQASVYMSVYLFSGIFLMSFGMSIFGAILFQAPVTQLKRLAFGYSSRDLLPSYSKGQVPVQLLDRSISTLSNGTMTSDDCVVETPCEEKEEPNLNQEMKSKF